MDDAASIAAAANDRAVWRQLRDLFPHPYQLSDARAFIGRAGLQDPPQALAIAVEGKAVGGVGIERQCDISRGSAEIGYWLGRTAWGKGIGTEAVQLVSDWAFLTFDLLRLYATPFADNAASCRVLEKAGYRLEGILRRSAIKDGEIRDQRMYARVPGEP
jgi:RimJ/RimL family protein N-acetyltransferase